jgi:hypothetical protein
VAQQPRQHCGKIAVGTHHHKPSAPARGLVDVIGVADMLHSEASQRPGNRAVPEHQHGDIGGGQRNSSANLG